MLTSDHWSKAPGTGRVLGRRGILREVDDDPVAVLLSVDREMVEEVDPPGLTRVKDEAGSTPRIGLTTNLLTRLQSLLNLLSFPRSRPRSEKTRPKPVQRTTIVILRMDSVNRKSINSLNPRAT